MRSFGRKLRCATFAPHSLIVMCCNGESMEVKVDDGSEFYKNKYCYEDSSSKVLLNFVLSISIIILLWFGLFIAIFSLFGSEEKFSFGWFFLVAIVFWLLLNTIGYSYEVAKPIWRLATDSNYVVRKKYLCSDIEGVYFPFEYNKKNGTKWLFIPWARVLKIDYNSYTCSHPKYCARTKDGSCNRDECTLTSTSIELDLTRNEYELFNKTMPNEFAAGSADGERIINVIFKSSPKKLKEKLRSMKLNT